jgi:ABC-2 type transport system permease protein
MLKKELLQTFRDPRMRTVILLVPVLQTLVFGYAATTDVNRVEAAVVDLSGSPRSRSLIGDFTSSGVFIPSYYPTYREAWSAMDRGEVQAMLFLDRRGNTQFTTDGSRGVSSGVASGYAASILSRRMPGGAALSFRAWFNPLLKSRNFYVPGVIAMMVMVVTVILSSMAVVREKEIGTMEQIMVTPIRKWEFILGKTLPFAAIGMVNVLAVSAVAVLWFRIPLQGSVPLLLFSAVLYLMNTLGAGLLISTVSSTQQQAMLSSFLFIFPAVLLSGFAFPVANMPGLIRIFTFIDPIRYEMTVLRGVFLKGNGLPDLWPDLAALFLLGTALLTAAVLRFRKTV